ncbi:VCBS domain-containing protein [Phenylobacterium sp.]|uniref:beta strand repeat-containing protein n=1 Tax=Phenylobacterium sp. TaxID=1871053 RepID=UPI002CD180CF|nr:VCBS domain-containing protein [Phenylobacterium sp.]HVI30596.1 VCBS domain-containing protein [Phenylobacterium sp.]
MPNVRAGQAVQVFDGEIIDSMDLRGDGASIKVDAGGVIVSLVGTGYTATIENAGAIGSEGLANSGVLIGGGSIMNATGGSISRIVTGGFDEAVSHQALQITNAGSIGVIDLSQSDVGAEIFNYGAIASLTMSAGADFLYIGQAGSVGFANGGDGFDEVVITASQLSGAASQQLFHGQLTGFELLWVESDSQVSLDAGARLDFTTVAVDGVLNLNGAQDVGVSTYIVNTMPGRPGASGVLTLSDYAGTARFSGNGQVVFQGESFLRAGAPQFTGTMTLGAVNHLLGPTAGAPALTFAAGSELDLDYDVLGAGGPAATLRGFAEGNSIVVHGMSADSTATLGAGNVLRVSGSSGAFDLKLDPGQNYGGQFFHISASGAITVDHTPANAPPVVSGPVTTTVAEGAAPTTLNALANASDADGQTLTVVDVPPTAPFLTYDAANHSFTLDPSAPAFNHLAQGQAQVVGVTYGVFDGFARTTAEVRFTVTGVNDAPLVAGPLKASALEGGAAVTLNALSGASDADDGAVLSVVGVPSELPAGVSYDAVSRTFTLDPAHAAYDHLAGGATTTVSVSYGVSDEIATTPQTVSWIVTGANDAPTVATLWGAVSEDGGASTLSPLTAARDVDDGAALTIVEDTGYAPPRGQVITVGGEGTPAALPPGVTFADGAFTLDTTNAAYQSLSAGESATVIVRFAVSDGVATTPDTVSWTVTGTNDAPTVSGPVAATTTEGGAAVSLDALAGATDVDHGAALGVVDIPTQLPPGVTYDAVGRTFALNPSDAAYDDLAEGQTRTVSVSYGVSDGTATTAHAVSWTVTGVNDAPRVAAPLAATATEAGAASPVSALAGAKDVDAGAVLCVTGVPDALPAGVTYDPATESFTLDPTNGAYDHLAAGQTRTVTVGYGVSDGAATTPQAVTWTVTGTNDAPTVSAAVRGSANEGGAAVTVQALAHAADADDGAVLSITGVGLLPAGVSYDSGTQTFTLDPTHPAYNALRGGEAMTVSASYLVSDGTASTAQTASWTVMGTNDAPTPTDDAGAVDNNASVVIDVLSNDSDPDTGDTHTLVSVSATSAGGHVSVVDGKAVYVADANAFDSLTRGTTATDSFSYVMRDGSGAESTATVTVTVTGTAAPPVVIQAGNGDSRLNGDSGDDQLYGGNGKDELSGFAGNDLLSGGNGKDSLSGGTGDDRLTGGNGNDQFHFAAVFGHDVVTDFHRGDQLVFNGVFGTFESVMQHAQQDGDDVVITLDGASAVRLEDVSLSSLRSSDFLFA